MRKKTAGNLGFGCRWDTVVELDAGVIRRSTRMEKPSFQTSGLFVAQGIDRDGTVLWTEKFNNMTTNVGLTSVLGVYLGAGTQITSWFMGLIDNTSFDLTDLVAGDEMSSHSLWTENTNYTNATRPQWNPAAAASQAITNTTSVDFTMDTGGGSIGGAFLVSNATKGGITGVLWATGAFSTAQVLSAGQVLKVTYTCTASAS